MNWITYHIAEEFFVALACGVLALKAFHASSTLVAEQDEKKSRALLFGSGFLLLGINSASHSYIHVFSLDENLLYLTLFGYCVGLLTIIAALSTERPQTKKYIPFTYIPLLFLLLPAAYGAFPLFADFRPMVWVFVSYLAGIICMLYMAMYYYNRRGRLLYSAFGFGLVCVSSVVLFFPAAIGSPVWVYGHLLRPVGFAVLLFSIGREDTIRLRGSILYRTITVFSLLAAIPLFLFGTVLFYESVYPLPLMSRRILIFLLLLVTLVSALIFGFGLIIKLIQPIIRLRESVARLADEGFRDKIELNFDNEIGELTASFNEMAAKLQESMREQDRLSRLAATGELAATLAHEIKNPLNAIGASANYIGKNFRGSLLSEFLKVIEEEADRINHLTTTLLNFARPVRPEPVPGDANRLVQETLSLMMGEIREHGIKLETNLAPGLPPANFDQSQMKQVLINLLLNAIDAVDANGLLKVGTAGADGHITFWVEDNGTGMREEVRKNIFNPFFTTKTRGTGLGLSVSQKIVKEHGGEITVSSSPGKGSRFVVSLPVVGR